MHQNLNIFMSATSYPRSAGDWQGLFIKKLVDALAQRQHRIRLWAPDGPRADGIEYACTESDQEWLHHLSEKGGIAHLLRVSPVAGVVDGLALLKRLRACYPQASRSTDVFHINWLQNALPLYGIGKPAVISVLGSDLKLLNVPGMTALLRTLCKSTKVIMAPNAEWMSAELERSFGDVATIVPVPFGIDNQWYDVSRAMDRTNPHWIVVSRVNKEKMGRLFEWGEQLFTQNAQLHLFGPNQDGTLIPEWVNYHGPATAIELVTNWFPRASGLITLSQHSEGRPQVILEAMAAGLPIVASDIPGHRDTIENGRNGYLVNSREDLVKAVEALQDPAEQQRISIDNKALCAQSFGTWSDCAARYEQLYERLLA